MRRAARTDDNQKIIVDALRRIGCSVEPLHMIGRGVPDLLVGTASRNYLIEVKDGAKCLSRRVLTDDESAWHRLWRGQVCIIESVDAALDFVNMMRIVP